MHIRLICRRGASNIEILNEKERKWIRTLPYRNIEGHRHLKIDEEYFSELTGFNNKEILNQIFQNKDDFNLTKNERIIIDLFKIVN